MIIPGKMMNVRARDTVSWRRRLLEMTKIWWDFMGYTFLKFMDINIYIYTLHIFIYTHADTIRFNDYTIFSTSKVLMHRKFETGPKWLQNQKRRVDVWSRPMENWVVVSNIFYFHPYLGKISNLTNIFQSGWNHQPENHFVELNPKKMASMYTLEN